MNTKQTTKQNMEIRQNLSCLPLKWLTLLVLSLLILLNPLSAQEQSDNNNIWKIETTDGNSYTGSIVRRDTETVVLRTRSLGELNIKMSNVRLIEKVDPQRYKNGEYWPMSEQTNRYFISPNSIGLKKGEAYFQNAWVFFNQATFGITDRVSLGAGMMPLFIFDEASAPTWITPRYTVPIREDRFYLGGGALIYTNIGRGELRRKNTFASITYGTATFGNKNANLTIGLGYGFFKRAWASSPIFSLGGVVRISKHSYLMTENYFYQPFGNSSDLSFIGARTIIDKLSLDYGLMKTSGDVFSWGLSLIPWLSVTIPLSEKY